MCAKRSAEEIIPEQQRTRIRLASPSPERSGESDTESIHSCQGYKTELANDTNDTSSSPSPEPENIEYEIIEPESSASKFKFYISDDSMEEEDILDDVFSPASNDSIDNAILGDTSEENSTSPTSNSDVDPGLPRNDYLDFEKCLLCKTDQKDISYPYCSSCFTWKKKFFPSRPKRRVKGFSKPFTLSTFSKVETECINFYKRNCSSNNENKNENEKNCSEIKIKEDNLSDTLSKDSGLGSSEPQVAEDTVDAPLQPSSSISTSLTSSDSSNLKISEPCKVCFSKPESGLFVHLTSAHLYGCYTCAKEIWHHNGGCPLCRRKVFKVTKLYS